MRFYLLLFALALAACEPAPPPALSPADAAERDSVLATLQSADTGALADAFDRLGAFRYRVEVRTEQIGPSGETTAARTVAATVPAGDEAPEVIAVDSSGSFAFGFFGVFASDATERVLPTDNPVASVLPESPAYLDSRGREAFAFTFAPDTLLGDRRVRVIRVDARPGEGDDQPIRHARLYLDAATDALVGYRLDRQSDSFVFSETSEASILLRPGPAGAWLPHLTRLDTNVKALFTDQRRFRLVRQYADFEPALSAAR